MGKGAVKSTPSETYNLKDHIEQVLADTSYQHGPNIVFNKSIDPAEVTAFIEANFDLTGKTGGYVNTPVKDD